MIDEVKEVIKEFKDDLTNILNNKIIDIVIHGSTVNGGFIKGKGDIDFVVFINGLISKQDKESIFNYHKNIRKIKDLKAQLEGCYYCLDESKQVTNGLYIGTSEKGWKEINRIVHNKIGQAEILNSFYSINNSLVVKEVFNYSWDKVEKELIEQSKLLISQVDEIDDWSFKIYSIYVSCRSLYTVYNKSFISKGDAVRWIFNNHNYKKYKSMLKECSKYRNPLTSNEVSKINKDKFIYLKDFLKQISSDIKNYLNK